MRQVQEGQRQRQTRRRKQAAKTCQSTAALPLLALLCLHPLQRSIAMNLTPLSTIPNRSVSVQPAVHAPECVWMKGQTD
jgi:hypothetical protein